MSFCRWSSDDYACDAYVWADGDGGYRTEIAGRRRVWKVELPTPAAGDDIVAGMDRWVAVGKLCDDESNFDWLDLPEPEGGRSYWHDTAAECADNLERLVAAGFNVPGSAIAGLRDEHATNLASQEEA